MANQTYASPGVYTSEKNITYTTQTVGVTTLGLVGETLTGPAFEPMFVSDYNTFSVMFGGINPAKFPGTQIVQYELSYIAKAYLSQSNQLYVTRVLGLSGYNAGTAYVIRTIGTPNQSALNTTMGGSSLIHFVANVTGGTLYVSGTTTPLINAVSSLTGIPSTKFSSAFNSFFNISASSYTSSNWYLSNVLYWNFLNSTNQNTITSFRSGISHGGSATPTYIDAYNLPSSVSSSDEGNYIFANEFTYNDTTNLYTSNGFALLPAQFSTIGSLVNGSLYVYQPQFNTTPNKSFHKKTIGVLRSRANYINDVLNFNITGTSVGYSGITPAESNPLASFNITGITSANQTFNYNVCLDSTQANYIRKVLGVGAFDKTTNLFVEELYDASINYGYEKGLIQGLHYKLLQLNNWNHYQFQYQAPQTPFFVSELRGGLPERLFRLIAISDGDSANTEYKISIANIDLDNLTFNLYIRDFNDTDSNPVFLEKYLNLSMDPTSTNYVALKIGTVDSAYPLISKYVMVDLDPNAPVDGIPCGFEGYPFATNDPYTGETQSTYAGIPEIPYKRQYWSAGQTIVTPPLSSPIISAGDKVNKVYLGFSDADYGYDADLLAFNGEQSLGGLNTYNEGTPWGTNTRGFHLDLAASGITNSDGSYTFCTGIDVFTNASVVEGNPNNAYYNINTRKYTALLYGGFDGWDIYRKSRTNTTQYKIGMTGFVNSGFATFDNPEYSANFGTFGSSDFYAYYLGILSYQNPQEVSINILATPGIDVVNNTDLVNNAIEIVEDYRMDSIYLPTLPDINLLSNTNPGDTSQWLYPSDVIDALNGASIDSNYTAVYYPWIQINDTENNTYLYLPPTLEVVRNLAYTDNIAYPWFATAGYNRGVVNCIRARQQLDQASRDLVYPAGINPIATFSDIGTVIWGNKNLQSADSPLNRLNIRRLLLQARSLIVSVSNRLLFDPNDDTVRTEFLSQVNPILTNIQKEQGLTDFRIVLTPLAQETDENTMTGIIYLKPTPALEFIELEFVVTPTNVSFDNIT